MQLRIRNAAEFHKLLFALIDEIVDAQIHFTLFQELSASVADYATEFGQSNTFWSLTFQAHLDAALLRLCKAFDQRRDSLNLRSLIETVKANLHLFAEGGFRQRLKGNPFVDSLAEMPRVPTEAAIQKDLEFVNINNPLIEKLTVWRCNFLAHRSPFSVLEPQALTSRYPLALVDIELLLREGIRILNEYSNLFVATTHSTRIFGHDDFKYVLHSIRESVEAHEAKIEAEFKRLEMHIGDRRLECAWCEEERASSRRLEPGRPRECPACEHVFQGNGWDGIDAHWKAKHESLKGSYQEFWDGVSQCPRHQR